MNTTRRVSLGAVGAVLPILLFLANAKGDDIGRGLTDMTLPIAMGHALKILFLLVIGGVVAYFYETEQSGAKIAMIGASAPALLSSMISTAAGIPPRQTASLFGVAFAAVQVEMVSCIRTPSFGSLIWRGFNAENNAPAGGYLFSRPLSTLYQNEAEKFSASASQALRIDNITNIKSVRSSSDSHRVFFLSPSTLTFPLVRQMDGNLGTATINLEGNLAVRKYYPGSVNSYFQQNYLSRDLIFVPENQISEFTREFEIPTC